MKKWFILALLGFASAATAQVYIDYRNTSKTHQIAVYGVFIDGYRDRYHHAPENRSMSFYSPPIIVHHPYRHSYPHRYSPVQGHEYRHNYNYHYHQYGGCPLVFDHRRMMNVPYCGEYR